jgi:hypothetical protein
LESQERKSLLDFLNYDIPDLLAEARQLHVRPGKRSSMQPGPSLRTGAGKFCIPY